MDTVLAIKGADFVLTMADTNNARSIVVFKRDEDKIFGIDSNKLLAMSGVPADNVTFGEYVQRNMKLYELEHGTKLSTHAAANFIRHELATALRRGPYQTNLLLAGYDEGVGPQLYWCDYLAAMQKVNFGVHGYAAYFCYGIFDREWKEGMTLDEAKEVLRKCAHELRTRFLVAMPTFKVKVVDASGTREIPLEDEA
mmetsp:Transcript_9538/g.32514  ORF Transcript_9538/g.32514 Transcript_9538/m.32514 type:complete len:197 (+) Transcript_9538:121-711(+)